MANRPLVILIVKIFLTILITRAKQASGISIGSNNSNIKQQNHENKALLQENHKEFGK